MNFLSKIISKYKDQYFSAILILFVDVNIVFLSSLGIIFLLQLLVKFDLSFLYSFLWMTIGTVAPLIPFIYAKTYRIVIRHMSLKDMQPFIVATGGKVIALILFFTLVFTSVKPFTVIVASIIDGALSFAALLMVRVVLVVGFDFFRIKTLADKRISILIYGTYDESIGVMKALQNSSRYVVGGFIKIKEQFESRSISGHKTYYYSDKTSLQYLRNKGIFDALLFPNESCLNKVKETIVSDAVDLGIKVLLSPSIAETQNGVIRKKQIREIKIEDLLGRQEILVDLNVVREYFSEKVVLVTGAAGSIGSQLSRQLAEFGIKKLLLFDNAETPLHYLRLELEQQFPGLDFVPIIGDVRSLSRLDYVFRQFKPHVVFHAAAYKHVPLMEENPCEAVNVNVFGSKNVADKCLEYNIDRMVMISTDKAVNPTNVMGCSKRIAEIYIQSLGKAIENKEIQGKTKYVTTRFGNVLGSNGSVIPRFKEQILSGGPVTVTHPDITRYFMTIPEACRLVIEAATLTTGNEIFVFDMGKPVKIVDLARKMINLYGYVPDKDIKIEYCGLRPGEKLYEEVLATEETTKPTVNEKIRIADTREYPYNEINDVLPRLYSFAKNRQNEDLVKLMKELVPEYISANSQYTALDNHK